MIQVYTGNGKGKTTAAIGQVIRAAGNGLKTYFAMFMKDFEYGEIKILKNLSEFIQIKQYGNDSFVFDKKFPSLEVKTKIQNGLKECLTMMKSGNYNIIVLDEVIVSIYFGLLETHDLINIISQKPKGVELILTGRYCPDEIIDLADLVTEMNEIKHYYQKGITSRKGFES